MSKNNYIMKTTNPTRKILKKIRHCKAQHNKYLETNPELAKEYFWKIHKLQEELNSINNPKPIQVYKQKKRMGIISKKPKFKKKKIDHSVEFQKRRYEREVPMLLKNLQYKYMKSMYHQILEEAEKRIIDHRLNVMFKLAESI